MKRMSLRFRLWIGKWLKMENEIISFSIFFVLRFVFAHHMYE